MSAADKIAEAPVFCEDEAAKAETNCRCDILHPSDHQERHTSPAGHIAEARALIEPLTGHDDGPWATAHRGTRTDFRKGRDYHRVTTLRDAVDSDAEAVAHVAWRPRREANAALIAAAPALRDTVAELADLADAQAQENARQAQRIKAMESALGWIALMPHSDECSSHIDDEDFPCDCHVGPADAALGDAP